MNSTKTCVTAAFFVFTPLTSDALFSSSGSIDKFVLCANVHTYSHTCQRCRKLYCAKLKNRRLVCTCEPSVAAAISGKFAQATIGAMSNAYVLAEYDSLLCREGQYAK